MQNLTVSVIGTEPYQQDRHSQSVRLWLPHYRTFYRNRPKKWKQMGVECVSLESLYASPMSSRCTPSSTTAPTT